jgi:hypothetical protein
MARLPVNSAISSFNIVITKLAISDIHAVCCLSLDN